MDYKTMWEELKTAVELDLESYRNGIFYSWAQAGYGVSNCESVLNKMKVLEDKYNN